MAAISDACADDVFVDELECWLVLDDQFLEMTDEGADSDLVEPSPKTDFHCAHGSHESSWSISLEERAIALLDGRVDKFFPPARTVGFLGGAELIGAIRTVERPHR